MIDDERQDAPQDEPTPEQPEAAEPGSEQPEAAESEAAEPEAAEAKEPEATEEPEAETPAEQPEAEEPAEQPEAEAPAESEAEKPKPKPKRDRKKDAADEPEVIPGAHLEPDLVLEDDAREDKLPGYVGAEVDEVEAPVAEETAATEEDEEEAPAPLNAVLELAADARYHATGKRKSAVARVTLKPGTGQYTINGKSLDDYFPRATLQTQARRPLETVGQQERMDVVARIHGGGVSAQAGALRHGITRALVEADPNLRGELKRRGFLTRDPRVKERKKAGLKKARKRPQFSKR
jgi:small subunit ribosomal protein S9